MPTFPSPHPIDLAIALQVGAIDIVAGDSDETVVTVAPTNPAKAVDRRGADETTVDFDGQRLTITGRGPRLSLIGPTESVDLRVELPTGSRLTAELSVGSIRTSGRLGATRIKALTGAVDVEATGDLWVRAGHGSTSIENVRGTLEITADHGQVRVGSISGDAIVKASHGSIRIGRTEGDVDAKLSYGDVDIEHALASVTAKTAYGSIRLEEVSGGSIDVESGYGQITVGVREGIPAWLDLASKGGRVRNQLTGDLAPAESEQAVAVRARSQHSDVTVQRAS